MALSGSAVAPRTAADSMAHAGVRNRILIESEGTYLATMLAGGDSTLRRWPDERAGTPLRVAVIRQAVEGFREDFVSNVGWALVRWNGAQLPVQLVRDPDTSGADIVVTWVARMDSNRTGRADVTYRPPDDTANRVRVAIELVKLEFAFNPGLASQTIGTWSEAYTSGGKSYAEQRAEILASLSPGIGIV